MAHNDNEQPKNLNAYPLPGQPHDGENAGVADDAASFVSAVLARLGLSSTLPSPAAPEEQLLKALHDPDWSARLEAVQHMEVLAGTPQLPALADALRDEHESVRVAAARALGSLSSEALVVVEALVVALRDPAWTVRAAAALALGKLKGRTPPASLVAALRDEDATVRASAASALATLGKQAPLEPLFIALFDSAWMVRESVVLALGEIGELGARVPAALFLSARSDADEPVRQAAELVLQRLYPELLTHDATHTTATGAEHAASTPPQAKLNGHGKPAPEILQPGRSKQPQRQPAPIRRRFFPRVAALVAAALLLIATLFSWLGVSQHPQRVPAGHTPAFVTSGIASFRPAGGPAYRLAWSPEGTEIASTSAAGLVQVRDAASGHVIATFKGDFLKVLSLAWLPDNTLLLAAQAADETVQVWNVLTGQLMLITSPLQGRATTATWSPDGSEVAFDGGDTTVQVWSTISGTKLVTYKGHRGRINMLSWSPDGTEIASASDDQTVQVWNAATGEEDWPTFVHTDPVSVVAWSPDNTRCAVATANGAVEVWDNPSWNKIEITHATVGWPALNPPLVAFITWSPDAAHLAFATPGGPVQVWDINTNRLLYTYPVRGGQVNNVAWSPDGTHIASANADGTVQIWPIPNTTIVNERLPH